MKIALTTWCLLACATVAQAQASLSSLRRELDDKREAAAAKTDGILSYEDHKELSAWYAEALASYLDTSPKAPDRVAARLELTMALLQNRERDAAARAIAALDVPAATMDEMFDAAELAERLALMDERGAWVDAAIAKAKTLEDRMRAGMILMTRMVEPDRADRLFDRALKESKTDDEKAEVRWWQAVAVREREDREDGDYETALERVVKEFPKTLYGRIAADRLRAMKFALGDPGIDLAGTSLNGETIDSKQLRGKVVAMFFWASTSDRCRDALSSLRELQEKYAPAGLTVFGVCLDRDRDEAAAFVKEHPHPWSDLWDGRGFDSPHALRTNVESVPQLILLDRAGKVAGLRLYLEDPVDIDHTSEAIERALAVK